jgi:CelD/BcsL family acetyltransferase involved in cellulose biosynthesis
MALSVSVENPDSLFKYWNDKSHGLGWDCLFILPPWLRAWLDVFGRGLTPNVCVVRGGGQIVGIAPLAVEGQSVRIIGSRDVCDYLDFIVVPGREAEFADALLKHLRTEGFRGLDCGYVRSGSALERVLSYWQQRCGVELSDGETCESYFMELPHSWQKYLTMLSSRHRHELRRKMRRLGEMGKIDFICRRDAGGIEGSMDIFIGLFRKNRDDKAAFMTPEMETFFRTLSSEMTVYDLTRIYLLFIDNMPVAANLCFEYGDTLYLYNNGYDRHYPGPGLGYLCKAMSIGDAIERRLGRFDFLRGSEPYKRRLGGRPESLTGRYVKLN